MDYLRHRLKDVQYTIMKKSILFIGALMIGALGFCQNNLHKGLLVNKDVALFYPADFDSIATLPSIALEKEPLMMKGNFPSTWKQIPKFYRIGTKSVASLFVKKGTCLYGTGEVAGPLLRNGKDVTLWNKDNYNYKTEKGTRLYQSHPWVLGVNADGTAFGILADNTWKQKIELGDSIRFISEGDPFRVFIIKGSSPQNVLRTLTDLTGKMPLPPLWALGFQQCRFSYFPDSRVKEIADTFRLKKIPCDVIWMDIDYMDKFKIFTFDKQKFPDPSNLNQYLHSKGFKSIWMIDPGVKVEKGYSVYESGTLGNHWTLNNKGLPFHGKVWPGDCVFPDFTRPETQSWWGGLYQFFMRTGIDGVWNDMNEPSVFDSPDGTMPEDNIHRGGDFLPYGSHLRYHNVYGMLMVKSSREGILKFNPYQRPFILSRSGFLGSQRYAATWTGDNVASVEHLKMSVPISLSLGLSGQPFSGSDIGGYSGKTTPELYAQWIALGAFYPFSRAHSEKGNINKEPWAFGQVVEDVARVAMNRRYRLLPYLYNLFYESSVTGLPVMRPVFFADVKDLSLRKEEQAFMLGNDLLIVPKWATSPALPKGRWTNVSLAGEKSSSDPYQPDVKIRAGAVVPLGMFIQNTTEYTTSELTLLVSLDKNGQAKGTLYEDEGNGFGYQTGDFLLSTIIAKKIGGQVKVSIIPSKGKRKPIKRKITIVVVS